jgi:hypothetical protein
MASPRAFNRGGDENPDPEITMTRSDLDPEDDGEAPGIVHWQPTRRRLARPADFRALALAAAGATALGALAVGALCIGSLAVGRMAVRRARFREVHIDRLTVGKLTVLER